MVRELMHDPLFLARKARPAQIGDIPIANDLLETLLAHRDTCVGMAANMIGQAVAIIAFFDGSTPMVMYNPEILKAENPYETEEGCLSLLGGPRRRSGLRRSKSAGRTRTSRPASKPSPAGPPRSSSTRWITAREC